MAQDYLSVLSRAVEKSESAAARQKIYLTARRAVAGLRPDLNLSLEQISAEASALERAIQQIEQEFNDSELPDDTPVDRSHPLRPGPSWNRIGLAGIGLAVVMCLSAVAYWSAGFTSFRKSAAGNASSTVKLAADLDPGIDGGSSSDVLPFPLQRQVIFYRTTVVPGSIVVDREKLFLYLVQPGNAARRYGIGITPECSKAGSLYRVASKVEWPEWQPSTEGALSRNAVSRSMPGGPGNPLGARALLLDQPERFIHGTNAPQTIGHLVARGCIRLVNDDVEDLYRRVSLETKVIMRN